MRVEVDDLARPQVHALLAEHLHDMHAWSPATVTDRVGRPMRLAGNLRDPYLRGSNRKSLRVCIPHDPSSSS